MSERFKRWYERRMSALYRYMVYQVGDGMLAEDLAAETCERAIRYGEQYDPKRGSYDAWMFGIARNVVRAHYRRLKRRPTPVPLGELPNLQVEAPTPEQAAEEADTVRRVLSRVPLLSPKEREYLALRYGAGLSYAEIATETDDTVNNVGVVLHRALKRLRAGVKHA
jgi:RNA polymerase sigma-70 factor (ECF subfamily)